jgi:hypothetical protein
MRAADRDALSAQRALMASKPRLDAEPAWFPGVAPSAASRVVTGAIAIASAVAIGSEFS